MPPTLQKRSVSLDAAQQILAAAAARAEDLDIHATIVVVDEAGLLKAAMRMDGAPLLSLDTARRKAYTSAISRIPTGGLFEFLQTEPALLSGVPHLPDLCAIPGGFPLEIGGEVVGAVGVSGGHPTQDAEIATAGLATIANSS